MKMEAATCVVDILKREGVRTVFGVPGGPVMALCDAILKDGSIEFVLTKHEQAAAYAAFGEALATGRIGVCLSTLGPGATNLVAGLPVAAVEGVPVLAITGQVQLDGQRRGGHQDSSGLYGTPDQQALFRSVCKSSEMVVRASHVPGAFRRAIRHAHAPRPGPVHISLPGGLLHETIEFKPLTPQSYRLTNIHLVDAEAAKRIAGRLATAKAPVLLLGVRARDCGLAAERLADRFGIALAVDAGAKSVVDEHHPAYVGCLGVLGHRAAENFVKATADLVLAIGQSFDEVSTLAWDPALTEGCDLVQIDSLTEEIGKAYPVVDATVGTLPDVLDEIGRCHPEISELAIKQRRLALADHLRRNPLFSDHEMGDRKVPLLPQRLMAELALAIPENAILLSDSSKWVRWLARFFCSRRGQVLSAHDYEPMGWAVAAALGVKRAFPERPVISLSGDGAFLMSALEVATAVDHRLAVVWMVFNDGRLGIIHDLQETLYGGRYCGTQFTTPDLVAFAESLGARGEVVEKPGDLAVALAKAVQDDRPCVLDVRFDVGEIPAMRPRSVIVTKGMGLPAPNIGPATTRALLKMLKNK
ncbi:thiamine pyrophosphate-binding protein [Rhizobium leguminosarum]|nr:thiamine pyrophosphate-binding protein [Rhizobium leguminosarum]